MTDAMPDFDNMTPDQISEWMESLARRQGATEGFTTAASMDVPQIDPTTVEQSLLEDTYIPFGWKAEEWQAQLDKEAREKTAKAAASAAAPASPPPVSAPPPAPVAAPAAQPAAEMTEQELSDFIIGLPLEKQLELLEEMGKQQRGEPNRVADLMPKLDESTVDQSKITKYVPYGWKEEDWDAYLAKEEADKQGQPAVPVTPAVAATPPPVMPAADLSDVLKAPSLDDLFAPQPAVVAQAAVAVPAETPVEDPMSWLTQLGGAGGTSDLPSVSFEDLNRGLAGLSDSSASDDPLSWLSDLEGLSAPAPQGDVTSLDTELFNLGNLAQISEAAPASSDDDDMNWLESIARIHGADSEELATAADTVIQRPAVAASDGPGYQPYSFENSQDAAETVTPLEDDLYHEMNVPDVGSFDDPESWLDSVAEGVSLQHEEAPVARKTDENGDPLEVMRALNAGSDVSPQAMETFFEKMFERAELVDDEPMFDTDNTPPIAAEIPDWLQESFATVAADTATEIPVSQMLQDLGLTEEEFGDTSPLVDDPLPAPSSLDWQLDTTDGLDPVELNLDELTGLDASEDGTPITMEIPAWLLEDPNEEPSQDISDIFADANTLQDEYLEATSPITAVNADANDPWVRAFAEESNRGDDLDAWYTYRVAALEGREGEMPPVPDTLLPAASMASAISSLQPANLPYESNLIQAIPVEIPRWLVTDTVPAAVSESAPISSEPEWFDTSEQDIPEWLDNQISQEAEPADALPDWLSGADLAVENVPDWLRETVEDRTSAAPPAVVVTPSVPVALVPAAAAPLPVRAPVRIDVAATLQSARASLATDVDHSLRDYESIVRANTALPEVVQDLSKMVADKTHKGNPAVHRVLGDALMRQGNLQDALATYRKALNLL